ncbi:MAG: hypothetical protein ACREOZ_01620 [Gloeomargaritales cyanobacterium]
MIESLGYRESRACHQVGGKEYPEQCGGCDPARHGDLQDVSSDEEKTCPPCTEEVVRSDLNRCAADVAPFLCSGGKNKGGCSAFPWDSNGNECDECCKVPFEWSG